MAFLRLVKTYQKILAALFGILFIIVGTAAALRWAKGYRFNFGEKGPELTGTGLLVASSDPKGAQVYVNGKLTTATDDTLNLPPGSYEVEIKKDGFLPWKKKLEVMAELVTQTTAKIFPSVPNLTPLTFTGAKDPIPSPDGQKIVYRVTEAANEAKNGLWILELSERSFAVARTSEPKQIARNTSQYDFSTSSNEAGAAKLVWTPDSGQVLAYWTAEGSNAGSKSSTSSTSRKTATPKTCAACATCDTCATSIIQNAVLLNTGGMNDEGDLKDVSARLPVLLSQWHQDLDEKDRVRLKELPEFMQEMATASARAMYFSPDEKRLLYASDKDLTIPKGLIPDLPAESTQPEERDVKKNILYVYDIEEDKNYKIGPSVIPSERSHVPDGTWRSHVPDGTWRSHVPDGTWRSESRDPAKTPPTGVGVARNEEQAENYWSRRLEDDRIRWEVATESAGQKKPVSLPPVPEELLIDFLADLSNKYSPIWQLPVQWFPTSAHLLAADDNGVSIMEYDGTNNSVVYSGPSEGNSASSADRFVYPWPNGSRLAILTNFNDQNSPTNLYAINLK